MAPNTAIAKAAYAENDSPLWKECHGVIHEHCWGYTETYEVAERVEFFAYV